MRQILFGEQWFHPEAPAEVVEIFNRLGRKRTFKKGEELKHGAPDGEITLLLTGFVPLSVLGYSGQRARIKSHSPE